MSVLDELVAGALEDQRARELTVSLEDVKKAALAAPAPIDATRWLKRADGIPVIAEIKRASPSKGHLSDIPDPAALAREYERGGASAISVLTEGRPRRRSGAAHRRRIGRRPAQASARPGARARHDRAGGDAHSRGDRTRTPGRSQGDRHQRAQPEEPQGGREQIQRTRGRSAR